MTNDFARRSRRILAATALALPISLPDQDAHGEPPFVQPDLVVRHGGRRRGDQQYEPDNPRPLTIRRRNRRPVILGIDLNGDPFGSVVRRDVRVAIVGPRKNRRATFRYFFDSANISGMIFTGAFSGFVDPGFNFSDLIVQVVPRKRKIRPGKRLAGVTIRAFDFDTGESADSVRAELRRR